MQMTAKPDSDRFQSGADKYAAYLETPEGRLRCDLAFANLQIFWSCRRAGGRCALWTRVRHGSDRRAAGASCHSHDAAGFLFSDAGDRETAAQEAGVDGRSH